MSLAPDIVIPDQVGKPKRSEAEHRLIYLSFIIEGKSGKDTADLVNARFGTTETRMSIGSYADRQGWKKAVSNGVYRMPKKRTSDLTDPRADPDSRPSAEARIRARPAGARARGLVDIDLVDEESGRIVEKGCRFPVGPHLPTWRMNHQLFCGEVAEPGLPYCPTCAGRAYTPAALQRHRALNAEKNRSRRPR